MLLVPRQLKRVGMTGGVAYYGGRLTPAQAYAASHPSAPRPENGVSCSFVTIARAPAYRYEVKVHHKRISCA